jgi:hypothetical protein
MNLYESLSRRQRNPVVFIQAAHPNRLVRIKPPPNPLKRSVWPH